MLGGDDLQDYHEFALELAEAAGELAQEQYNPNIPFEPKGDNSPVTKADLAINRLVIERCQEVYPDIPVMGEEESAAGSDTDLLWVCDPIDGTTPYALGMQASTFCLALVDHGVPVIGVVYDFMSRRMYHAVKGQGAFMNDMELTMPEYKPLKLVNFEWWHSAAVEIHDVHELFFAKQYQLPNYTSSGFMGMQVAQGRIAGQVYMGTSPWDVAALKVVAEETGCIVRNLDDEEQPYDKPLKGAICANPEYYDEILSLIRQARV